MINVRLLPLIGLLLMAAGCRRETEIQTYRVSKENSSTLPAGAPAQPKEIIWKTPAGWREQPASAMRIGSFLITGANGQTADVSIVPLSGPAGGDLANINRWRGQINLDPLTPEELAQNSRAIKPAGRPMLLIDFVSKDALVEGRYKQRLIAAIYTHGDRTWFFKMLGDDETARSTKAAFIRFLEGLRFAEVRG